MPAANKRTSVDSPHASCSHALPRDIDQLIILEELVDWFILPVILEYRAQLQSMQKPIFENFNSSLEKHLDIQNRDRFQN